MARQLTDQTSAFDGVTPQLNEFLDHSCDQKIISVNAGVGVRGRARLPVLTRTDFVD